MISSISESEYDSPSALSVQNKKRQCLLTAFINLGKDDNSTITEEEAIQFFRQQGNLTQNFIDKMIKAIFEGGTSTTVGQFIRNFLDVDTNIKISNNKIVKAIQKQQEKKKEIQAKINANKNERLNSENINDNSPITIELIDCNFQKIGYDYYAIKISFKGNEYTTDKISSSQRIINNEAITFQTDTKNGKILFELIGYSTDDQNKILLGTTTLDLKELALMEEYEIDLKIPDSDVSVEKSDEMKYASEIKAKVLFIWSFYSYYTNQLNEVEANIPKLQYQLEKAKNLTDQINSLKVFRPLTEITEKQGHNVIPSNVLTNDSKQGNKTADENLSTLSSRTPLNKRDKLIFILWFGCFFFASLYKSDFINGFILLCVIEIIRNKYYIGYFLQCAGLISIGVLFDVAWLILCSGFFWKNNVSFIQILSCIATIMSLIIKIYTIYNLKKMKM